ncbi:pentapeptide repeat-containing protein [Mogibacterium timidum]
MTREMTHEELQKVIEQHKHWINEDCEGWQDLRATLRRANLHEANLYEANLYEADINYSCLPLLYGSLEANFDNKQLKQLIYHVVKAGLHSKNATEEDKKELSKLIDYANQFHRAEECGEIRR